MKERSKVKCIAIVLVALIIVGGVFIYLRGEGGIVTLLFPPKDLYEPLTTCTFAFDEEGKVYDLPFTPRYHGNHGIDIIVAKPQSNWNGYGGHYIIEVAILNADGSVFHRMRTSNPSSFWGGPDNSGMTLTHFRISKPVSKWKNMMARVTVHKADRDMGTKYGPFQLRVRKRSDI